MAGFFNGLIVTYPAVAVALGAAGLLGFLSAVVPSYTASKVEIVQGLRNIG